MNFTVCIVCLSFRNANKVETEVQRNGVQRKNYVSRTIRYEILCLIFSRKLKTSFSGRNIGDRANKRRPNLGGKFTRYLGFVFFAKFTEDLVIAKRCVCYMSVFSYKLLVNPISKLRLVL